MVNTKLAVAGGLGAGAVAIGASAVRRCETVAP